MDHGSAIREFEIFFREYYTPVLRYCTTIVKDTGDAEDVVQRIFVLVWEKRNEIEFHTSARAYLYKAVYNASLDYLKHEKVKEQHQRHLLRNNNEGITTDRLLEKELNKKIDDAINQLPEQCGKIFRMSRFGQLKYSAIARQLDIAEKTVEGQMSKALKLLREMLKDYLFLWIIINYW